MRGSSLQHSSKEQLEGILELGGYLFDKTVEILIACSG